MTWMKRGRHTERTHTDLLSTGSGSKSPQPLGLGHAIARNQEFHQVTHPGGRGSGAWVTKCCFSGCASAGNCTKEPGLKPSTLMCSTGVPTEGLTCYATAPAPGLCCGLAVIPWGSPTSSERPSPARPRHHFLSVSQV